MRQLPTAAAASLASDAAAMILTTSIGLDDGWLCFNSTRFSIAYDGKTYLGAGQLGSVDEISGSPGEMPRAAFVFSGVGANNVSLVLNEKVRGRPVEVGLFIVSLETGAILHHQTIYKGVGDVMSLEIGDGKAEIKLESESGVRDLLRPPGYLYSHLHQQQLHPGDMGLQFLGSQVEQAIIWPAKEYFQK